MLLTWLALFPSIYKVWLGIMLTQAYQSRDDVENMGGPCMRLKSRHS